MRGAFHLGDKHERATPTPRKGHTGEREGGKRREGGGGRGRKGEGEGQTEETALTWSQPPATTGSWITSTHMPSIMWGKENTQEDLNRARSGNSRSFLMILQQLTEAE